MGHEGIKADKTKSNQVWQSEADPDRVCDACDRIAKMKDGRTHLAYKAEHVVALESETIVAAEIYPASRRNWKGKPEERKREVFANRRRIRGERGCRLQRQRRVGKKRPPFPNARSQPKRRKNRLLQRAAKYLAPLE